MGGLAHPPGTAELRHSQFCSVFGDKKTMDRQANQPIDQYTLPPSLPHTSPSPPPYSPPTPPPYTQPTPPSYTHPTPPTNDRPVTTNKYNTTREANPIGVTAIKPVGWDRTGLQACLYFIFDPSTCAIFTRTPLSWLKIIVFYNIFYSCLLVFWLINMFVFGQFLPLEEDGPRWKLENGLIGNSPGLDFRPKTEWMESTLVNVTRVESHKRTLRSFLSTYNDFHGFNYKRFDISSLGPCGVEPYGYLPYPGYGATNSTPCFYIKLNKIWGWLPTAMYDDEPLWSDDGPRPLPESLVQHLKSEHGRKVGRGNIWIDCQGRYAADKEALEGGITYYPASRALPFEYFPYMGSNASETYHSPLVAVQINPRRPGQLIHIECRAYYSGVVHDSKTRRGLVQFAVQMY